MYGKNLISISSHIHPQTHNTKSLLLLRSNYQLIKRNPQFHSINCQDEPLIYTITGQRYAVYPALGNQTQQLGYLLMFVSNLLRAIKTKMVLSHVKLLLKTTAIKLAGN